MDLKLSGKRAFVSGSTKGIGLALARRMAEAGARVVISSRNQDVCEEVAAGIRSPEGIAEATRTRPTTKLGGLRDVPTGAAHLGSILLAP